MTQDFKGRREDIRFIQGLGRYATDCNRPGQLFARFLRADRAHAEILHVDKRGAAAAVGVVAVAHGEDLADAGLHTLQPALFPNRSGERIIVPKRPALARARVRYVGEEVAVVIAETAQLAADAVDLIAVSYTDLPPVIGFDRALADNAPLVHAEISGNVCFEYDYGDAAATAAAIAGAAHVVTLTAESPRVAPVPMEPRAVVASYNIEADRYEIHCSHQGASGMAAGLAAMLGVDADRVRVELVDVGGAFGPRGSPYAEYVVLLHMARRLGRPIKWVASRSEDFCADSHGRAVRLTGELAVDADGRFLALRTLWHCDEGAYLTSAGALTNVLHGQLIAAGPYRTPLIHGRHRLVMTNTTPTNAYRGAGRPEAVYLIERLVDEAAAVLRIDPIEIRRRNALPVDAMPHRTPSGSEFDSGDFPALLRTAEQESGWQDFPARREASERTGRLRGIGCSMFLEPAGGGVAPKDEAAIHFGVDGKARVYIASQSSGQGHETVFPELVAGWLGIDPASVVLRASDPDGPKLTGSGAFGSRTGMIQGSLLAKVCDDVIRKGRELASEHLEVSIDDLVFHEGTYGVKGTDRSIGLATLVELHAQTTPHPLNSLGEQPISRNFPSGVHVSEVEIDPQTGATEVVAYLAVDDIGTVLNSVLAKGQLVGGITQGAGQVFGEHCIYDEESGQLLTGSFMDYFMPRADLMPAPSVTNQPTKSPANRLGAKGVGEAGTIGATPCLMNAIVDALRHAGVEQFDMPATPPRVWAALRAARQKNQNDL